MPRYEIIWQLIDRPCARRLRPAGGLCYALAASPSVAEEAMADGLPAKGLGARQAVGSRWTRRAREVMSAWWRRFARKLAGGYRPERHYMRGPGPKSFERNSRSAV